MTREEEIKEATEIYNAYIDAMGLIPSPLKTLDEYSLLRIECLGEYSDVNISVVGNRFGTPELVK